MNKNNFQEIANISSYSYENDQKSIEALEHLIHFDFRQNLRIKNRASTYIDKIRLSKKFGIEQFLQRYNLSSDEGVAIMCLAECLLRIPDKKTSIELLIDKLSAKDWVKYINSAKSITLELSSIGFAAAGVLIKLNSYKNLFALNAAKISNLLILEIIKHAIKFLSTEFIIGFDIQKGIKKAKKNNEYLYSFDLLGESSRSTAQADHYYDLYIDAIDNIGKNYPASENDNIFDRPNLSVKLSALHPRVEMLKWDEIQSSLLPKLVALLKKMSENNISVSFDAEEAKRQEIYLKIITSLFEHKDLKNYNGIGFVVQAYQKRATKVINYICKLAKKYNKQIPVRLVKGAYWDSEIKYAQENGFIDYPVYTNKVFTDASYLSCAKLLLSKQELIYPQFATHNAYTAACIIDFAGESTNYEMQKLYGMGDTLHEELVKECKVRIYAPVGKMNELLAYLMRRLLENGASTSFVNKVNDSSIDTNLLLEPIYEQVQKAKNNNKKIILPNDIYQNRINSKGIDLGYIMNLSLTQTEISKHVNKVYNAGSIIGGIEIFSDKTSKEMFRPGNLAEKVGSVSKASANEIKDALQIAINAKKSWASKNVSERSAILRNIATAMEDKQYEIYSLLLKEAGKTINDAVNELREAVDFCRYYADLAEKVITNIKLPGITGEKNSLNWHPRGVFLCISPWNFPLAIFTGQVVAALVCGNSVIAKPAAQTCIIANFIVKLMHEVGVPKNALQLIIAKGSEVEEHLVSSDFINGIVFTGSTETAKKINQTIAARKGAIIPLIAETGGQNAMIVDSSALLEQVADDVINSAFYSAGQRCSALRVLYIQEEIYEPLLELIKGSLEHIKIGDTIDLTVDVGPVIDAQSMEALKSHVTSMEKAEYNVIANHPQILYPIKTGTFFCPYIIEIESISSLAEEQFGPILHVIKYKSDNLDKVIEEINNCGYGLTFGIHSRIESKIDEISKKIHVGNFYANRTITGAQVESHPFGGENMSGTGFKAGGPHYLLRFMTERSISINLTAIGGNIDLLKE